MKIYLKNISCKTLTKSSGIFLELQKFKDVLEEEEEKISFGP